MKEIQQHDLTGKGWNRDGELKRSVDREGSDIHPSSEAAVLAGGPGSTGIENSPKVSDIEAISPELVAQIYAEGYTRGFTEGALAFLDERSKLDTEKVLQQQFAEAPAN